MTAATVLRPVPDPAADGGAVDGVFGHVLAGVELTGPAATLAARLEPAVLAAAGWDPAERVLRLPSTEQHPLWGRKVCRVPGCSTNPWGQLGVCGSCFRRMRRDGLTADEIATTPVLPERPIVPTGCLVAGCPRSATSHHRPRTRPPLCSSHAQAFAAKKPLSLELFLAHPDVVALPALPPAPPCRVAACVRTAAFRGSGLCGVHHHRWHKDSATNPGPDAGLDADVWWATTPAVAESGLLSLRGLPPLVAVQVLFGLARRVAGDGRIFEPLVRPVIDTLRRERVTTVSDLLIERVPGKLARSVARQIARDVRRALADPAAEQELDVWDLAVFGHVNKGRLTFTGLRQPWLRQAAKRWAADQLQHHRRSGIYTVRNKINALVRLSDYLHTRPEEGLDPTVLDRAAVEGFCHRLAFLETGGDLTAYVRYITCGHVRSVLTQIRALGLTRPGGPAAGLGGDFGLHPADIPAQPERAEPGRDLPLEILATLTEGLDTLHPVDVRAGTQIIIDTGRRPEEILALTCDCLRYDRDGKPVLVYDNHKGNRLGRRLPISKHIAEIITTQQHRVRALFPDTPPGEVALLPAPRRNSTGRRALSSATFTQRHRDWVTSLGELRTKDGLVFDSAAVVHYAYRHNFAQRHADAGTPIDVLAELMNHSGLDVTRRYYRVGEDRRRAAVDKVTELSFDRHGNRVWRDAQALLGSEHARYAIGEVAVPYGTCTEPSNVQAGGGACPIRYRCVGCDHLKTDVSRLPDLQAYLDDLLRTRERLAASVEGVDDWARVDATPAQEEITRVRKLINRIKAGVADLDPDERARIDNAVTVVRRHRAAHVVPLAMPTIRTTPPTDHAQSGEAREATA